MPVLQQTVCLGALQFPSYTQFRGTVVSSLLPALFLAFMFNLIFTLQPPPAPPPPTRPTLVLRDGRILDSKLKHVTKVTSRTGNTSLFKILLPTLFQ
jgi:hypothetical protein